MSEIEDFLKARLDEDEQWARACSQFPDGSTVPEGAHWRWGIGSNWEPITPDPVLDEHLGESGDEWGASLVTMEEWPSRYRAGGLPERYFQTEEVSSAAAGHITRHDPARVLREVAAKRKLIDVADDATGYDQRIDGEWGVGRRDENADPYLGEILLRLLAHTYSDHPEWQPAWAIEP